MKEKMSAFWKESTIIEKLWWAFTLLTELVAIANVIVFMTLGNLTTILVMLGLNVFIGGITFFATKSRMPYLALLGTFIAIMEPNLSIYFGMGYINSLFYVLIGTTALSSLLGIISIILKKQGPGKLSWVSLVLTVSAALSIAGSWGIGIAVDKGKSDFTHNIFAVPSIYDGKESSQPGTLSSFTYETKAYATDKRTVTKRAFIYLPYQYDETKQYDILYLMHGTGDDEAYWMDLYTYNKWMVDNLIEQGKIKPLIIVMPSWYVENDCLGDDEIDTLTFTFNDELRNELMPYVESHYGTYAETVDKEGFIASRHHRAFAGLSRGSFTTFVSALCKSLDYFSSFGLFSGIGMDVDYMKETLFDDNLRTYDIDYIYESTGTNDFLLKAQLEYTPKFLALEDRVREGVNFSFDVFPYKRHSMPSWHLALYNFLQHFPLN